MYLCTKRHSAIRAEYTAFALIPFSSEPAELPDLYAASWIIPKECLSSLLKTPQK